MAIEVELPNDIELKIRANRDWGLLVRRRLEHQIQKDIKNDLFLLMTFDDLLENSELTEDDAKDLDHRMKRDYEEARMEIVLDTNILISSPIKT